MLAKKLHPIFQLNDERLNALKAIIPEALSDGKIHWQKLKEVIDPYLEDEESDEHYGLNWPGKRKARALSVQPSGGSLYQATGEGISEKDTGNMFIEGDNLEVLKLMQKSYAGRIKMIYIDPPYNTGNDFVYEDKYKDSIEDYLKATGDADEKGLMLMRAPEQKGHPFRFKVATHSNPIGPPATIESGHF